jgi:hypothetical protein
MEETRVICVAVAMNGTVCAATPLGTVVVELSGAAAGRPEVITSMQPDLASEPVELARYPLRRLLALALHAMRPRRRRRRRDILPIAARLPALLRRAQRLALAQFLRINFDTLMLLAHAAGAVRRARFRRWPALWPASPIPAP